MNYNNDNHWYIVKLPYDSNYWFSKNNIDEILVDDAIHVYYDVNALRFVNLYRNGDRLTYPGNIIIRRANSREIMFLYDHFPDLKPRGVNLRNNVKNILEIKND
jgi:hypothetical protein